MRRFTVIFSLLVLFLGSASTPEAGRYYFPHMARWATPDPTLQKMHPIELMRLHNGMLLSASPYSYVYNNPLKYTDPDGNVPAPVVGAVVGAGFDIALQMGMNYYQGRSVTDISWKQVGVSAALGAGGAGLMSKGGRLLKLFRTGSKTDDVANIADDVANLTDDTGNLTDDFANLSDDATQLSGKNFTEGQLKQFQKQFAEHGSKSLEKSKKTLVKRLNEHLKKLEDIQDAGGHTSSVEREIRNFRQQISAIDEILGSTQ